MKKGNRKADYFIVGVLLLLFAAVIFSVAVRTKQTSGISPGEYPERSSGQNGTIVDHSTPVSYFSGKTIGTGTGNVFDDIIEKSIPGVQMQYYNVYPDMLTALINEKIDAICIDEPVIKYILAQNTYPVEILDEKLENYSYGFVFPKTEQGEELCDEFNEFIEDLKESGELDEIENRWFSANPDTSVIPDGDETASPKGTLELAVDTTNPPFVYLDTGRPVGYEIDIAHRFCREYGYRLEIRDMSFDAIISSISSEMCDFGCSVITITEERKQSVYFSEPDYNGGAVLVVKSSDTGTDADKEDTGLRDGLSESLERNFIKEDRYKLIIKGVATTMLITVSAVILGSLLAFGICMFRRTGSRLASVLSDIYVKLLQGTPMVVLLMILYYVVLGKTGLSEVWVAIIGFSLNFGAYASEIMRSGIESIDDGQREAALALGHSENQAFFRYIFPQAVIRFIPVYNQEIVSLLKNTSVVGYIAIQDLTKMSDIIRSRTYEAFFPLMVTAVIYFVLAWIITMLLKGLLHIISPKRKRVV